MARVLQRGKETACQAHVAYHEEENLQDTEAPTAESQEVGQTTEVVIVLEAGVRTGPVVAVIREGEVAAVPEVEAAKIVSQREGKKSLLGT